MTMIDGFLQTAGWAQAQRRPLAGDASARRYERLTRSGDKAVLMITTADEITRFAVVDSWLRDHGFSAPQIYAQDAALGLMMLEDLGDDLVSTLLQHYPERETELYTGITDFALALHRLPPPDFVADLDGAGLAALVDLTVDWAPVLSVAAARAIGPHIADRFAAFDDLPRVLSLRDFHAQNALWLPNRQGVARLGLLDFQDAVATHPAYDLVSALQDVRRAVSPATEALALDRYITARALPVDDFHAIYALLGAQRALRIHGIFARLCLGMGKTDYLNFMPLNWANLLRNLAHPALAELAKLVHAAYLPPNHDMMKDLKDRCATRPMP